MADLEEILNKIKALPQDFDMRKRIEFDGHGWVIWVNESDIAKFTPAELEASIQYMYKVQDIFNLAGLVCRVETFRW